MINHCPAHPLLILMTNGATYKSYVLLSGLPPTVIVVLSSLCARSLSRLFTFSMQQKSTATRQIYAYPNAYTHTYNHCLSVCTLSSPVLPRNLRPSTRSYFHRFMFSPVATHTSTSLLYAGANALLTRRIVMSQQPMRFSFCVAASEHFYTYPSLSF